MNTRRHLLILLMLTVLIRGLMFISYPMGGQEETQGFYRFNIEQLLAGNLQIGNLAIGNLRNAPGYPLFIAPIAAIGERFGRFDERVVLLFQLTLSATIPFLLYDVLRTRHSPGAAFLVALLSLADPFGLQWAHFWLPVWLAALCLVLALWLLHHAERRRSGRLVAAAGMAAGFGVLARWNFAPVAAGIGLLLLFSPRAAFRRRLRNLALFGVSGALLVLLLFATIQLPATGVWYPSSVTGLNLLEIADHHLELRAAHGPHSERLLRLGNLPPLAEDREFAYSRLWWSTPAYPLWQNPASWAGAAKREVFIQQEIAEGQEIATASHALVEWLYYYLGPRETDQLMRNAYLETIRAQWDAWLRVVIESFWDFLQAPLTMGPHPDFTLPHTDHITYRQAGGKLGFARAVDEDIQRFYNGQWVWRPGIALFSLLWAPLNALRTLVLPALVWACFTRWPVYRALALVLLLFVLAMAVVDLPEFRIYAIVYPLAPALAGGLLATVWERWRGRAAA